MQGAVQATDHQVEQGSAETRSPRLSRFRAQTLMSRWTSVAAPALAAGLIGFWHLPDPLLALLLAGGTLTAARAFGTSRLPLHLIAVSRIVLAVCAPLLGAAAALALGTYLGYDVVVASLYGPVLGAWLVSAVGSWAQARFEKANPVRLAVIGTHQIASALSSELDSMDVVGYEVVATVMSTEAAAASENAAEDDASDGSQLDRLLSSSEIDLLIDAAEGPSHDAIFEHAAAACLEHGVSMMDASQFYESVFGHVPAGTIGPAWFRYLIHPSFRPGARTAKRVFDLGIGLCAALFAAPIVALAALAIRLEDSGPAFYRQRRVGERGREFWIVKLRTMRTEPAAAERWSGRDDDRITRVGRILRAWHLDELPQLWNVLRGEMTLVGPRPEQPSIVANLERRLPYYQRRQLARPGITGWAQVRCGYGGSEVGTAWKLCHDLYYLKRRSLFTDFLVLLETLRANGHSAQYGRSAPDPLFIVGQESNG